MNYEKLVRVLRHHAFDDRTDVKEAQFKDVLGRAIEHKVKGFVAELRGQYSGLTCRELAMSGTCETDWY